MFLFLNSLFDISITEIPPVRRNFLHIKFQNKGIDAVNISNILNNKHVQSAIPPYFKNKETPLISYTYSTPVASKIFNYKEVLQSLDLDDFKAHPPSCTCSSSPYLYSPAGHVVTGDLNIVENEQLKNILAKGPKYREPKSFSWKYNFKLIMDSVEDYARRWASQEEEETNSLSEWVKSFRSLLKRRISKLQHKMSSKAKPVLNSNNVASSLSSLHDKYVVVPVDKASNNIAFVCKTYYINCLLDELGLNDNKGNPTYTLTTLSKEEVISNHKSVLQSFRIKTASDIPNLPYIYWIPKLHKNPYKQRYIAGSSNCTTKPLSQKLTKILSTIKDHVQKYCDTAYSRSGVNQMWILKNSKDLLHNLDTISLSKITSIKSYDFTSLYTTIPHTKLKDRLSTLITDCFFHKNGNRRYKYLVFNKSQIYFVQEQTKATEKYTEKEIIKMMEFLVDNIFVEFGGQIFQQTIGIPMGTNCAPLLADLFLYSYEAEFMQEQLRKGNKNLASKFNLTFRYIDDVLSINNDAISNYLHFIYPPELEINETTESHCSASYLDLFLEFDRQGKLSTKIYDKRDDFNFPIVNFPYLTSNIPASPAYGVFTSQLIRYARASSLYKDFIDRSMLLARKLLTQGYEMPRLVSSLRKFYGRHHTTGNKIH